MADENSYRVQGQIGALTVLIGQLIKIGLFTDQITDGTLQSMESAARIVSKEVRETDKDQKKSVGQVSDGYDELIATVFNEVKKGC